MYSAMLRIMLPFLKLFFDSLRQFGLPCLKFPDATLYSTSAPPSGLTQTLRKYVKYVTPASYYTLLYIVLCTFLLCIIWTALCFWCLLCGYVLWSIRGLCHSTLGTTDVPPPLCLGFPSICPNPFGWQCDRCRPMHSLTHCLTTGEDRNALSAFIITLMELKKGEWQ